MSTTIITTSTSSTTGYKMLVTNADGIVHEYDINATDPKNESILKLPENPSNRKWLSSKKVIDAGGTLELSYKESIKIGERAPKIDVITFLNDDEREELENAKARIDELMNIAKMRREEAKKPMSEKEKLLAKIEKYKKMLENLGDED